MFTNLKCRTRNLLISLIALLLWLLSADPAFAHQPILERNLSYDAGSPGAVQILKIKDPTAASEAVYGRLSSPMEVDIYSFISQKTETIPVQLLVPMRVSNKDFMPVLAIVSQNLNNALDLQLPVSIPGGNRGILLSPEGQPEVFHEPFSIENLKILSKTSLQVQAGQQYFLAVFEPGHYQGDYTIGIGTVEDFHNTSFIDIIKDVGLIKLGLVDSTAVPWMDIIGLFIFLAGFVVGHGAVTVIDLHGFLGRNSSYWTEATTRTHKVTKPLIWLGFFLGVSGACILYRESGLSGVATFQALLAVLLFLNGLFLSFWVSPRLIKREREGRAGEILPMSWQIKIAISFIISFTGWWGSLFLLVWYLLVTR